ncbi:MAG: hypothetical protein Q4B08_11795 [Propionibacteriaceae bacterium]|nr:hypothetical protein [Propionibacteriaceae bacterium]
MSVITPAHDGRAFKDFYSELSIDRELPVSELQEKIQQLRLEWRRRAAIVGKRGEEGRQMLRLLDWASETFADEDSKERYDRELRARGGAEDEATINWVNRAWTYYFRKDFGPASVAARKARQHNSDDPTAYVVSAWIELAEGEYRRAEEYASEAYVLDELHEDTFDVHQVRGVTFYCVNKYDRAVEALQRALTRAPEELKPETYWRLSVAWHALEKYDEGLNASLLALEKEEHLIVDDLQAKVLRVAYNNIDGKCSKGKEYSQQKAALVKVRGTVEKSDAFDGAKRALLEFVDKMVERADLGERTQEKPAPPDEEEVDFPLAALGAAVLFFMVFLSVPGVITFVLFAAPAAWVAFRVYLRQQYRELEEEYGRELKRYESDLKRVQALNEEIREIMSKA